MPSSLSSPKQANTFEPRHAIFNNVVWPTSKASDQPAHMRSLMSLEYSMSAKPLTEHNLEFLSLEGGCTGLSESTLVKMPQYWKSHFAAHLHAEMEQRSPR